MTPQVIKIVSGAQTGVDRAALDFALEHGIEHGGWVPRGRKAEDGRVPDRYHVREHFSSSYPPRTEANVKDSDATAVFTCGPINDEPGCLLTVGFCRKLEKPYAVANLLHGFQACVKALQTLPWGLIRILNVAGARGSLDPDTSLVKRVLFQLIFQERPDDDRRPEPDQHKA